MQPVDRLDRFARDMRRAPTEAESVLYPALLSAFNGFEVSIRCQEPISYFIADFMLYPQRVVIECDGGYHQTAKAATYDRRRETALRNLGIRVLRFPNQRIIYDTAAVIAEIISFCGNDLQPKQDAPCITICPPGRANASGRKVRKKWSEALFYRQS